MLENKFKTGLVKELKERFPGCKVVHLDPTEIQGIPDLLVLYGKTWGALEGRSQRLHLIVQIRTIMFGKWTR